MTLRIQRPFIAAIAAVAIAITGISAAPARADDKDVAKALAIVLGLAAVGVAISNRDGDKKAKQEVVTRRSQVHRNRVHSDRRHVETRRLPRRVNRKLLPQQCLTNLRTQRGERIQGFGRNCLSRHYEFSDSLPRHCGERVRTRNGRGFAFEAQCLSRQGYQLSRR